MMFSFPRATSRSPALFGRRSYVSFRPYSSRSLPKSLCRSVVMSATSRQDHRSRGLVSHVRIGLVFDPQREGVVAGAQSGRQRTRVAHQRHRPGRYEGQHFHGRHQIRRRASVRRVGRETPAVAYPIDLVVVGIGLVDVRSTGLLPPPLQGSFGVQRAVTPVQRRIGRPWSDERSPEEVYHALLVTLGTARDTAVMRSILRALCFPSLVAGSQSNDVASDTEGCIQRYGRVAQCVHVDRIPILLRREQAGIPAIVEIDTDEFRGEFSYLAHHTDLRLALGEYGSVRRLDDCQFDSGHSSHCPCSLKGTGAPMGKMRPISPFTLIGMLLILTPEFPILGCTMPGQGALPGLPCAHIPWATMFFPPAVTVVLNDWKIQTSRPGSTEGAAGGGGIGTGAGALPWAVPTPRSPCTSASTLFTFTRSPASLRLPLRFSIPDKSKS